MCGSELKSCVKVGCMLEGQTMIKNKLVTALNENKKTKTFQKKK